MAAIKKSSSDDFEKIALQFAVPLYRLAYARVGNATDAEDIVQETYLKAYRNYQSLGNPASMKNWLNQILINTVRDHFRKGGRQVETVEWDDSIESAEMLAEPGPEEVLCDSDIHPHLMKALGALPEQLLVPLLLREIEEASYEEIAQILDVPKGTVMSRLSRARGHLRRKLCNPTGAPALTEVLTKPNCE